MDDSATRDYVAWHDYYDDPGSGMSWRLSVVREAIATALDERTGPVRVLSLCAGDGRDVLGVLAGRSDAERVAVTLVELDELLTARAREAAATVPASVDVRTADAGTTAAFADATPADLVLLVGIFGNVSRADVARTIEFAPACCAPGATVVWSRGGGRDVGGPSPREAIRAAFTAGGFTELAFDTLDTGSHPGIGVVRYDGPPVPLPADERLFTFVR